MPIVGYVLIDTDYQPRIVVIQSSSGEISLREGQRIYGKPVTLKGESVDHKAIQQVHQKLASTLRKASSDPELRDLQVRDQVRDRKSALHDQMLKGDQKLKSTKTKATRAELLSQIKRPDKKLEKVAFREPERKLEATLQVKRSPEEYREGNARSVEQERKRSRQTGMNPVHKALDNAVHNVKEAWHKFAPKVKAMAPAQHVKIETTIVEIDKTAKGPTSNAQVQKLKDGLAKIKDAVSSLPAKLKSSAGSAYTAFTARLGELSAAVSSLGKKADLGHNATMSFREEAQKTSPRREIVDPDAPQKAAKGKFEPTLEPISEEPKRGLLDRFRNK